MSIEYRISHDGLRIETYPKGVLDIKETIEYFDRIKNDGRIKQGAVEIVYFKYVIDFNINFSEIERITKSYQEPKNAQMIAATLFVCETDLAYGMGRMLQTFHEITNPKHNVILARSESELEGIITLISQSS
jgi:hypothetical protein